MAKRKLAQRKAKKPEKSKEENHQQKDEQQDDNNKQNGEQKKVAPKRARKRVKTDIEPEYFEDKRNLEDLWKEVFPVGTEWDQMHLVYQYNWNFINLEDAFEEGGELHGKRVYLFGCTEPQMVPYKDEMKVTHVPVVVAVVSPFPPSDKIGIKSVQREAEEIVPMKNMKMDWVPYIPLENRERMVEKLKSEIFILRCTQRRTALRYLKEERVKKFEYCLPYFYDPLKEDEFEQSTIVTIMYDLKPKQDQEQKQEQQEQKQDQEQEQQQQQEAQQPPVVCEFDWEFDELEEFTDKLIEEEVLPADQKEDFKEFVKSKVREAKKANREAREARKKAVEEMSSEKKDALENMKFYKFYPVASPDTPDVSGVKAPFINRYYGKAHKIL